MRKRLIHNLPLILGTVLLLILVCLPTGYEDAVIYQGTDRCKATILATDESAVISSGLIQSGEQTCTIRLEGGRFEGRETQGINILSGSLETDKIFTPGEPALVVVSYQEDQILSVTMIDHYRIDKEILLALAFALLLILLAGRKGFQAILSFGITVMAIWKIIVPCCLKGDNPIGITLAVLLLLTAMIFLLVYGFDRRCLSASLGTLLGILTTCLLAVTLTDVFQIHGTVMSYSETLLYSGFENLNLTRIFMSSIFLGASGALMDLAVDITSSIHEVVQKKPGISWREASMSGIRVGQAAMGTMTTTLLFAYSGGYLALLMVFMAQGTPVDNILNYKYISAEILDTIVGSIGLVTVAPFTAVAGGFLLTRR